MRIDDLEEEYDKLCSQIRKAWLTLNYSKLKRLTDQKEEVLRQWLDALKNKELGEAKSDEE